MTNIPIYYAYIYSDASVEIGRSVPETALTLAQSPSWRLLCRAVLVWTYHDRAHKTCWWPLLTEIDNEKDCRSAVGALAIALNEYMAERRELQRYLLGVTTA